MWAQELGYSHAVVHRTAHNNWAQRNAVHQHTSHIVRAQEFAYSHAVFTKADIVETKVYQFQKDRDEQARFEFTCAMSMQLRILIST